MQPDVRRIHRLVKTIHLALQSSLAKGRSRWALVRRFAARCECFERDALIGAAVQDEIPERALTLAFARYLFDAGFNPLVDTKACGLRPDVFDATSSPAVYVEAKQYEHIASGISAKLRDAIAQTVTTWDLLADWWWVPEAFILVFRRSGRSLSVDNPEAIYRGRKLYLHCVNLAPANESGSRAAEPVVVDLAKLMPIRES